MMKNITIFEIRILILVISICCVAVKAYYYLRIQGHKSMAEFIMDFFHWAPKIMIKNCGADKERREYMRKNNYCALIFWITIFVQLFLLFHKVEAE